jgi:tetratricopeptide (TPR) repeat protein
MAPREILDGWKEISDYLKRDVRTCQRWERELGLPVHRLDGSPKARVFAYKDELDAWRDMGRTDRPDLVSWLRYLIQAKPLAAVLLLIIFFGLGALLFSLGSSAIGVIKGRTRLTIAVLPFQNTSGRAALDKWTLALQQLMLEGLSGSKYYGVLPNDSLAEAIRAQGGAPGSEYSTADLRRICKQTGATHSVTGLLLEAGKGMVFTMAVRKIGSDDVHFSRFECEDEDALIPTADRMADQVKWDLGLTRSPQAGDFDAVSIPVTTSSLEAFRLYNEGRRFHVSGDYAKSARIMHKTLARDPDFALAWRSLGVSLLALGAESEGWNCLKKALELSRSASKKEQFYIKNVYFHVRSECKRALEVAREWSSFYPNDTQATHVLGRALLFEEDAEGAWSKLDECLRKGESNPYIFLFAALACTASGRFSEAERIRERGLSVHADNPIIGSAGAINAMVQGYYDSALSQLVKLKRERPWLSLNIKAGDILLLKGEYIAAEREYDAIRPLRAVALARLARLALAQGQYGRAADLARKSGDDELLDYIHLRRGRLTRARDASERVLRSNHEPHRISRELVSLYLKGEIEALGGNIQAARECSARLRENGQIGLEKAHDRAAHCLGGLIGAAEGRRDQAIEEFEVAVELLPRDLPYLDDDPYLYGAMANLHATILYAAAQAHEKFNNIAAARERYLKLIGLHGGRLQYPDLYALSQFGLGRLAEDAGDIDEARGRYVTFLDLWKNADPGLSEVEDARMRLAALDRVDNR